MNKTFLEVIEKFNPYHDKLGRFTTSGGATVFTWRTKDSNKQHLADKAISRAKDAHASSEKPKETPKRQFKNPFPEPNWTELEEAVANPNPTWASRSAVSFARKWLETGIEHGDDLEDYEKYVKLIQDYEAKNGRRKQYKDSGDGLDPLDAIADAVAAAKPKKAQLKEYGQKRATLMKTVASQEKRNRHLDKEEMYVYNADGKVLLHKKGNEYSVAIDNHELNRMKNAVLTHNHPSHSPLSEADINLFVKGELLEIRATTTDGKVYSLRQTQVNNQRAAEDFQRTYELTMAQAEKKARAAVENGATRLLFDLGQATAQDLEDEFGDLLAKEINSKMGEYANRYGYKYEVTNMEE